MSGFSHFGGIDFSGAKEPLSNPWAAVGTEHEGKLRITALCPLPFREDLRAHVAEHWRRHAGADDEATVLWVADVPFARPEAATRAIAGERAPTWAGTAAWVADRPPEASA